MLALGRHLPQLAARIPWVPLGDWPTPLTQIVLDGRPLWIKHEGASSPRYGGNKVRTLEPWFGLARERGARRIWTIGAYGSNHAIATAIHGKAIGLGVAAILFPQPTSSWAIENCGALLESAEPIVRLRSVAEVPFVGMAIALRDRTSLVMPPGGATTVGTFGSVSGAFELAEQIEAGLAPPPARIVIPVGSTCTISGLLAGIALARGAGIWRWPFPVVHGVRVTPWPVTSHWRIANLARATIARAERLGGPRLAIGIRELASRLVVDPHELGRGYGRSTPRGEAAIQLLRDYSLRLDGVYSAKAMAAALRLHRDRVGPLLFWSTKSEVELATPSLEIVARAPRAIVRWLLG